MARIYCGILGLLSFLTTLVRGWIHGGDTESILRTAWLNLLLFGVIGLVIGWIAERIVEESVNARLAGELSEKMKNER
ncbi:MAG: hypothetical protein ABSG67_21035 [Thermoguttaceae bacterium]